MDVRTTGPEDIAAIVNLLKASLGESLMPKSEAFWQWKHIDNPFGASPVIGAFDSGKLVGIRAFMHWRWVSQSTVLRAVRAVDTATHPDFQGKGIFKKLTLSLVEKTRSDGVDFIFNTPNKSSKPGYLKMGWETTGKLKMLVRPLVNLRTKSQQFETRYQIDESFFNDKDIKPLVTLGTDRSSEYLRWRYLGNPNVTYFQLSDRSNGYWCIFRLKPFRAGVEFRVCDSHSTDERSRNELVRHCLQAANEAGAAMLTVAGEEKDFPSLVPRFAIGPEVTVRPLSTRVSLKALTEEFWKPSLGDLEVF